MSTPPGVLKRNGWGPILYECCPVQYNREKKRLEIKEGTFAGQGRRDIGNVKEKSHDHDAPSDEEEDNDDDVGNDDEPVPFDVVADYISPGLCLILKNNGKVI